MKKSFGNLLRITVLATILSLAGLAMSGAAMAWQCVDSNAGTVTDNISGLMWQKETAGPMSWEAAIGYAAGLNLGGKTGWRLPTKDELLGLYHSPCLTMMSARKEGYWSSSAYASYEIYAWLVHFYDGYAGPGVKTFSYYVRAVRDGR